MANLPEPPPLPAAERERVVEVLTRHFVNDDINEAELDVRLQRVYAATTRRELEAVLSGLPGLSGLSGLSVVAGAAPVPASPDSRIKAVFSGQERKLVGPVPRGLKLRARLGYVELDLTEATFEPGVTTIDVRAFMGYVQIRVPAGVRVESAGRALFGYFAIKGGAPGNAPSVVRITGRAAFGFAEVFLP